MTYLPRIATLLLLAAAPAGAEEYDCLMVPAESIELGSPVTGVLEDVLVGRGDRVTHGQVVARLNSQMEISTVELLSVRANSTAVIDAQTEQLALIQSRYDRSARLREQGLVTQEQFDQIEAELIAARSLLFQAELNQNLAMKELERSRVALDLRDIRSPIDGIVALKVMSAGEYLSADDYVLEIVQLDPLRIEAFLPVSLFGSIAPGDVATIHPVAPLDGAYEAKVTVVDRVFDAASGTFVVELSLPNPDWLLPAGHRCRVSLSQG